MNRFLFIFRALASIFIIFVVYRFWIGFTPLSAGDWSFHFPEEVKRFLDFPSSWAFWLHGGLGSNSVFITGLEMYFLNTARWFYATTGLGWAVSERVIWFMPFLIIGYYSSIYFIRLLFPACRFWWLSPIIFLTNTYILMVTGGGQMGVAMAYALAPLVLAHFVRYYNRITSTDFSVRLVYRQGIVTGLALAFMILFDPRLAYIVIFSSFVYWGIMMLLNKTIHIRLLYFLGIPFIISGVIHLFWLLPLVVFRSNPFASLGDAYTSIDSVKFFSFADFSHALSFLHPNWPENVFGKMNFLQPEFLFIPILAFSSLFFIKHKSNNRQLILIFSLVALLGIFFAKGTNDPGGWIYLWLFRHVPGFTVFRDPTKFYLLTAISYSILIPVALDRIGKKTTLIGYLFVLFWFFTIRQSVVGQLGGTFITHKVPYDYEVLKDFINKPGYFRTFWVPHVQRYGFSAYMHPAIDAGSVLNTSSSSAIFQWINSKEGIDQLSRWSVKYVILPYDSQKEIYIEDRKYSERQRQQYQTVLDTNSNLLKINLSGLHNFLSVYETTEYMDHVWLEGSNNARLTWSMISPTSYVVSISELDRPATLIFSESYDPYWQIKLNNTVIHSKPTADNLNSFLIPSIDSKVIQIIYTPQQYVTYGLLISIVAILGTVLLIIKL